MPNNCAWCHEPGDMYGSHSICEKHAAEMQREIDAFKSLRVRRLSPDLAEQLDATFIASAVIDGVQTVRIV